MLANRRSLFSPSCRKLSAFWFVSLVVLLVVLIPCANAQVAPGDLLVEPLGTGLTQPLGIVDAGDGNRAGGCSCSNNRAGNGTGFVPASVVRWNATDRPTTFISSTELQAAIPASDIGVSGSAQVTVFNPAPGGGASNAQTFTITDFSLDVSPASRTINAGQSAVYTVTITPELGSFGNSVSLACSNLPSRTSCSFSPSQLTPNNSSVTSALTVSTTASSASLLPWLREQGATPLFAFWLLLPGLVFLAAGQRLVGRKKSRVSDYFMAGLLLIMLLSQLACGGGGGGSSTPPVSTPGTPTGTHTITITGTSGSVQHSITVTLIVQ